MKPLPYLPAGKRILYVPETDVFMQKAKQVAQTESLDAQHRTGAVLVKDKTVIGAGANGSIFHKKVGCVRKLINAPTGKMYWACGGCSPKNHAEQKAIKHALAQGNKVAGADLYLWGHWWCCESCWEAMIAAEVNHVFLPDNADEAFSR